MKLIAAIVVVLVGVGAPALAAQDPAQVEGLAPLLMAEDRRAFDDALFQKAVNDPDPLIRQTAVLSIGRIGDHRGTPMLVRALEDRDQAVVTNAFFALGLMRDSTAVAAIAARIRATDSLSLDAVGEAATALARIGGPEAARFIASMLSGGTDVSVARQRAFAPAAIIDAWHLGALMPAQAVLHFVNDTSVDLRWRALYSLGRLRVPGGGPAMISALRDATPAIRETAAKYLTRKFADTASLPVSNVEAALARALDDEQPGIRTNALASLATFGDSSVAAKVVPLLTDADPNVRVAAATTLGELKGSVAARALDAAMDRRDATWALRRSALDALARTDTAIFARRAAAWLASPDWHDRAAALQSWATVAGGSRDVFHKALNDPDPRVQAIALGGPRGARNDTVLIAAARVRLRSPDPGIRAAAASALRTSATEQDIDALLAAWRMNPGTTDARAAVLATLHALSTRVVGLLMRFEESNRRDFLQRPDDPLLRADAARTWPELAARWGINGRSTRTARSRTIGESCAPISSPRTIHM